MLQCLYGRDCLSASESARGATARLLSASRPLPCVNAFLFAVNLLHWNGYLWAKWPAFGWGIGIIVHGMETFSYRWGGPRKEAMIRREMERQARANTTRPAQS
jgi:2TM domain